MSSYAPCYSPSGLSMHASTTFFRSLSWEGTVLLEIRVDLNELPAHSDRGVECYYIQAPRVSYLPLLVPKTKRFLLATLTLSLCRFESPSPQISPGVVEERRRGRCGEGDYVQGGGAWCDAERATDGVETPP